MYGFGDFEGGYFEGGCKRAAIKSVNTLDDGTKEITYTNGTVVKIDYTRGATYRTTTYATPKNLVKEVETVNYKTPAGQSKLKTITTTTYVDNRKEIIKTHEDGMLINIVKNPNGTREITTTLSRWKIGNNNKSNRWIT